MGRNYNILVFLILTIFLICCKNDGEHPDDLMDYHISLKEAVGEYIYIPVKIDEYEIDDYKYLNLKRGDTLKLEIRSDSTFTFNYFYHDNAIKTKNFTGKFTTYLGYKDILSFSKYPDGSQYVGGTSGFKKGEKTYFYLKLINPNDKSVHDYQLYYEKVK